jgi:murein L,D-transpeptidase YcbB/YkuD
MRVKALSFPDRSLIAAEAVRAILRFAFLLLLVSMFSASRSAAAEPVFSPRDLAVIRLNIIDLLTNDPDLPLPVRQRQAALLGYYSEDAGTLLWLGADRTADFIARLRGAAADGLDPSSYPADQLALLIASADKADKRTRSIIELHFSAALLEYASDLQVGRFLPRKVDPNFFVQERSIDQVAALKQVASAPSIEQFFLSWEPSAPEYRALKAALSDYRALAVAGGWPSVPLGDPLKPGMSDERVKALRARLAVTGEVSPKAAPGAELVYDDELVGGVKVFQSRHGLDADGVIGAATIVALNVPVDARVQEIVVAMERWRWMPEDLGSDYIIVNIAGFDLQRVHDGKVEDRMSVVVGKPYSRTPAFSDAIRYVELNPYWNVPTGIALKEELPKLRQNPSARASAGFEAVQGNKVYPLTNINWSQYGPGNFPFQIRQRPGPKNALGRVKFVFPNKFNVYLHDTPATDLFSRSERAFSHGCIRLSRPIDLAEQVLSAVPGWNRDRVDAVVASGVNTAVNLTTPLPVHITYLTAWVDNGTANFRRDIYEQDVKLETALNGQSIAW